MRLSLALVCKNDVGSDVTLNLAHNLHPSWQFIDITGPEFIWQSSQSFLRPQQKEWQPAVIQFASVFRNHNTILYQSGCTRKIASGTWRLSMSRHVYRYYSKAMRCQQFCRIAHCRVLSMSKKSVINYYQCPRLGLPSTIYVPCMYTTFQPSNLESLRSAVGGVVVIQRHHVEYFYALSKYVSELSTSMDFSRMDTCKRGHVQSILLHLHTEGYFIYKS